MFDKFPKQRPPLTKRHKEIYESEYLLNRNANHSLLYKLVNKLESWNHNILSGFVGTKLLEIGAGTLNHLKYENGYEEYDVVEPGKFFIENSESISLVNTIYDDILEIKKEKKYDKIFSVAVLEHLTDLPVVIAKSGLLLNKGGEFLNSIPTEGGLLWGLSWRLTTGISYRLKNGIDYNTLMEHEHINDAKEIEKAVRYFYKDVTVQRFPFPLFHFSFYTYIIAKNPDLVKCSTFLKDRNIICD